MSDQWHKLRSENIGGSDVAALFTIEENGQLKSASPYMSAYKLWHIKAGNLDPDDLSGSERVEAGNFMEPAILAWANHRWNMAFLQPHVYMTHAKVKGMGCTPDALHREPDDRRIMAQVKNVDSLQFRSDKGWESDGEIITKAPLHILLQIQHELEVADLDESWLIVCVGGNTLKRMMIMRDREIGKILCDKVARFWDSIAHNEQPEIDVADESTAKVAIHLWQKMTPHVHGVDMTGNNELYSALAQHILAKADIKSAEAREKDAKTRIVTMIGNASKVVCGDITVTMVQNAGTEDHVITADEVGTVIKGKATYAYPLIKQKK